jgi:sugar phosphate isomerase/epimerase
MPTQQHGRNTSPASAKTRITRRNFLNATAAVIGAAGSVGAAGPVRAFTASAKKTKIVVGAHPWVYAARQPKYDITPILDQIFADMRWADIDAIELMHTALLPDDAVARIGRLSKKHGLPILGTSFGGSMWDRAQHDQILGQAETVITRLAKLGGRTFGTSVGRARAPKTPQQLDAQADLLRKIMAVCEAHGVVLNLHNHTYEVENGMHDLRGTLERIPQIKLGPDLNWLVRGGVDPVRFIRSYADQIVFLHLRDQKADGKWSEAMGEGQMDHAAIGRALRDTHFQGDAVIELAHERDFERTRPLRESLKMSRRFVKETLGF